MTDRVCPSRSCRSRAIRSRSAIVASRSISSSARSRRWFARLRSASKMLAAPTTRVKSSAGPSAASRHGIGTGEITKISPTTPDEDGDHLDGPADGVQATGHGRRVDHEHAGPAVDQRTRKGQGAEGRDEDQGLPVVASPERRCVDRQEERDQHRDRQPVQGVGRRVEHGLEEQRAEVDQPDVAHVAGGVRRALAHQVRLIRRSGPRRAGSPRRPRPGRTP